MAQELLPPEKPAQRDDKGRWQAGCDSPNPTGENGLKGKARWDARVQHYQDRLTPAELQRILMSKQSREDYTLYDWEILMSLKNTITGKSQDMTKAQKEMRDRLFGRAVQTVVMQEGRRITQEEIDKMTDDEALATFNESIRS